jgi:hypothetical protein
MGPNSTAGSVGSGPHARFPAERVIADATGGMIPKDGDILLRKDGRWVFESLSAIVAAAVTEAGDE